MVRTHLTLVHHLHHESHLKWFETSTTPALKPPLAVVFMSIMATNPLGVRWKMHLAVTITTIVSHTITRVRFYEFSDLNPFAGHPDLMRGAHELFRKGLLSEAALEAKVLKNPDNVEGSPMLMDNGLPLITTTMLPTRGICINLLSLIKIYMSHANSLKYVTMHIGSAIIDGALLSIAANAIKKPNDRTASSSKSVYGDPWVHEHKQRSLDSNSKENNTFVNVSLNGNDSKQAKCLRTPRPTLYEQNETPDGLIYWEPHVEGIPIPVEGTYYDTIDEALDMYTKYAEMAGFEVKKGGQRLTKSGAVQHKYLMCNKEGVPKGINIDTLDPEYNKQKRNTTAHVTGCKARIRLVMDIVSAKYKLVEFKPKHNHILIPKEYKHFTKKQRKMNQSEKMFVVKAATNKIGATRAHNLYCSMKGGYEYVHGTTDDFKNHQRDVNQFIGESDAQMLINKMENRKKYVPNFTFQYKVENSELVAMFWADEVAKCNYKEFGDIVSFDATFNSNKYNMKFVPFIGIDNHGKCVTLGSGMLLHEDTQSYTWLLTAFMTAFLKEPTMIVTDQDGAMKRAIEAVFKKAKHRLCMWHIIQKIPSKMSMESEVIHIEIRISLESQMIHVESQVIRIESHEFLWNLM
ncbi:FAR1-related sequence 5-like protein [Tanacetum coccineum]|uniref:FAR1-related sequence 5-like protein n=1 Tax=Tanacetum coccineum TaxID=301880 RepID=A0ABQ5CXF2_9ASTR